MINNITNTNNKTVSFKSIKPTIKIGEEAIRYFNTVCPKTQSSTRFSLKIHQRFGKPLTENDFPLLERIFYRTLNKINELKKRSKLIPETLSPIELSREMIPLINEFKAANCITMLKVIRGYLLSKGIKIKNVGFYIIDKETKLLTFWKRSCNDHSFIVLGMAKEASSVDPKTWGSKAVIVNPWLKEVAPAHELLRKYKSLFGVDTKTESIVIFDDDVQDLRKELE